MTVISKFFAMILLAASPLSQALVQDENGREKSLEGLVLQLQIQIPTQPRTFTVDYTEKGFATFSVTCLYNTIDPSFPNLTASIRIPVRFERNMIVFLESTSDEKSLSGYKCAVASQQGAGFAFDYVPPDKVMIGQDLWTVIKGNCENLL